MISILEKLLETAATWFRYITPIFIMGDDHIGLVRRWGRYHRNMAPGVNWKWPGLEEAMSESGALDSTVLREQTLTTVDGFQVTLRGVLTYRAINPRRYILRVGTTSTVVNDVGCSVLADVIPSKTLAQVLYGDAILKELRLAMRERAIKWGAKVYSFGLVDRVQTRTYRLITSREGASE